MLKRKFCYFVFLIFIMVPFLMMGCQGMTPKQKVAAAMNSYSRSYDDYMIRVKNPNPTEEEKKVLRVQYEILNELYNKIQLYDQYVTEGKVEYAGVYKEIDSLLLRLEDLLMDSAPIRPPDPVPLK